MASQKNNYKFTLREKITIASGIGASFLISKDLEQQQTVVISNASITLMNNDQIERFIGTCAGDYFTIVLRGLEQGDSHVSNAALKRERPAGTECIVTVYAGDMLDTSSPDPRTITTPLILDNVTFTSTGKFKLPEYANDAARDAAITSPSNGMAIYHIGKNIPQDYISGSWVDRVLGSVQDATETAAGKVEQSTIAEQIAATETGGTGSRLFLSPKNTRSTSAGAADEGMLVKLDPTGKVSPTMLPQSTYPNIVLGENMTAADVGFIVNNSGVKLYKYIGYIAAKTNITGWTTSGTATTCSANSKVLKLDATRFVVVYNVMNGANDELKAIVGTIAADNTVSYGTAVNIRATGTNQGFSICEIGTNKFAVASRYTADGTQSVNICTVSGTTITAGALQSASAISGNTTIIDIAKLGTDKFMVYSKSNIGRMRAATVSGTTVSFGVAANPTIDCTTISDVATDKVVATDGTNARIYTVSGTTVTEQAALSLGATYTTPTLSKYDPVANYVIFSGTTGGNVDAFILDCTGTTATKGTTRQVATGTTNTMNGLSMISDIVVITGGTRHNFLTVSGTTLKNKNNYTLTDSVGGYKSYYNMGIKAGICCLGGHTTNPSSWVANNNRKQVLGVLQTTGLITTTQGVSSGGTLSSAHTGLSEGELQYVSDSNGTISNDATSGFLLGISTSTTQIVNAISYSAL